MYLERPMADLMLTRDGIASAFVGRGRELNRRPKPTFICYMFVGLCLGVLCICLR